VCVCVCMCACVCVYLKLVTICKLIATHEDCYFCPKSMVAAIINSYYVHQMSTIMHTDLAQIASNLDVHLDHSTTFISVASFQG